MAGEIAEGGQRAGIEGRCGRGGVETRGPTGASGCPPRPGKGIAGRRTRQSPRISTAHNGRPAPLALPAGGNNGVPGGFTRRDGGGIVWGVR
ncbi:hypothetical protein KN400_3494 [Geobacter sulfurreducens KN400]|nr:hypothetical protein KN400_3494 [Geobacter sulfurreducens KN400]